MQQCLFSNSPPPPLSALLLPLPPLLLKMPLSPLPLLVRLSLPLCRRLHSEGQPPDYGPAVSVRTGEGVRQGVYTCSVFVHRSW
mmetsp:Transcript_10049/g.22328  ORF Transcript_10049/g.22328 Transcript_10049/m.22328 type:complete len:84 (+) Transcript_10049:315-566(+)